MFCKEKSLAQHSVAEEKKNTGLLSRGNEQKRQARAESRTDLYRGDSLWRGMESFCKGIDEHGADPRGHSIAL